MLLLKWFVTGLYELICVAALVAALVTLSWLGSWALLSRPWLLPGGAGDPPATPPIECRLCAEGIPSGHGPGD